MTFGLLGAVFLASLLGSGHCVGMCGPFVLLAGEQRLYSIQSRTSRFSPLLVLVGYNGGRLLVYVSLGFIAGSIGSAIDFGGSAVGFQKSAAVLAGSLMILFGVLYLFHLRLDFLKNSQITKSVLAPIQAAYRWALSLSPGMRSFAVGTLSVLLPCGWLYAFVATAAATASPFAGAAVMAAFWLGTVPALSFVRLGLAQLPDSYRRMLPALAASIMILSGSYLISVRASADYSLFANHATDDPVVALEATQNAELPCCMHGGE